MGARNTTLQHLFPKVLLLVYRSILPAIALFAFAFAAKAAPPKVTCETNAMTDEKSCSSEPVSVRDGAGGYSTFADKHGISLLTENDTAGAFIGDAVMVRIDGAPAFRIPSVYSGSRPSCHRGSCVWQSTAVAIPSAEQWQAMMSGGLVLIAVARRDETTEPNMVEPGTLAAWYARYAAEGMTPSGAKVGLSPVLEIKNCCSKAY